MDTPIGDGAVLGVLADHRHELESTRVGGDRTAPVHKGMDAPSALHETHTGTRRKVKDIDNQALDATRFQVVAIHRAHYPPRRVREVSGQVQGAMGSLDCSGRDRHFASSPSPGRHGGTDGGAMTRVNSPLGGWSRK